MLRRLRIRNFKSWLEADLELGPVTALFGPNSSGKTSIIQYLLMLKQTKESTDRAIALELNGDHVRLGTYSDVVYAHDESRSLDFVLEWQHELVLLDPSQSHRTELAKGDTVTLEATVRSVNGAPQARSLRYTIGNASFQLAPRQEDARQQDPRIYDLKADVPKGFKLKRMSGRPRNLPGPIKTYAFPDQARTYYQNAGFLSNLEASFESLMDNIFYLGPLREDPHRDYLWARSRPSDVGRRGEKAIDAILAATDAKELRNLARKTRLKTFQEMVAYWLREMGLINSFKVEEISPGSNRWQAKIRVRPGSTEVLLTDVGFGVSQVLPVVTLLYFVPEGSTVILEKPEIHLHPLAQAHLADLILKAALRRRVQVIVESHSEHLLLRLQRRIADKTCSSNDVRMYFCDIDGEGSKLVPLELDLLGNIRNWPKNFMGDQFGEVAAAEKARLHRTAGDE